MLLQEGKPRRTLIDLARRHGIEVGDDVTAQDLSNTMQDRWLRKTEHQYQIPGGPPEAEDLLLLRGLGLVDAEIAPDAVYRGALLLGATVTGVRNRLAYLSMLHAKLDIGFNTLYLLGGERPLDPVKESPEVLCTPGILPFKLGWTPPAKMPTTEAGMMLLVCQQSVLPPSEIVLIDTPLQPMPGGKTRNPNTADTAAEFLKVKPGPGTYLVVSSQPFIARQTMNVQRTLGPAFRTGGGVGYEASATTPLKTFLDEVARLLHEELQFSS